MSQPSEKKAPCGNCQHGWQVHQFIYGAVPCRCCELGRDAYAEVNP